VSLQEKAERTSAASIYLHDIRLDLRNEGEGNNKPTANSIKNKFGLAVLNCHTIVI